MLRQLVNEAIFDINFSPAGPLLIKSGRESADPTRADMEFIRTYVNGRESVYVPGSSLKGVIRSQCERILRTVGEKACFPTNMDDACGKRLKNLEKAAEIYRSSCPACRIFGSTKMAGRAYITDAYPIEPVRIEQRTGVAINRISGSVAGRALFNAEVVTEGTFKASLKLTNFEVWQLGLIGLALGDVRDGLVTIGFGKSRGFGQVNLNLDRLQILYHGFISQGDWLTGLGSGKKYVLYEGQKTVLHGVGSLVDEKEYGFSKPDQSEIPFRATADNSGVVRTSLSIGRREEIDQVLSATAKTWTEALRGGLSG